MLVIETRSEIYDPSLFFATLGTPRSISRFPIVDQSSSVEQRPFMHIILLPPRAKFA